MDPVKVFSLEVVEMIFVFLSGKELLEISLVSQDWNDAIRSSSECMGKLFLSFRGDSMSFTDLDKEILMNSKYSDIMITDGHEIFPFLYDVMNANINWKSVKIYCTEFETTSDFINLVKSFESTAEHVVLHQVKILNPDDAEIVFNMKKLKSLTLTYTDTKISLSVLHNCLNLESLTLGNSEDTGTESIVAKVRQCKKLKNLYTGSQWFNSLFEIKTVLDFQLEDLSVINRMENLSYGNAIENQFVKFLETQMNSMKKLHLGGIFSINVVMTAMRMTNLEELIACQLSIYNWFYNEFPANSSIQILDIAATEVCCNRIILSFIKSVPNLKYIRLRSIDYEVAKILAENMKHLVKVCLVHSPDDDVKDMLPKVEWC